MSKPLLERKYSVGDCKYSIKERDVVEALRKLREDISFLSELTPDYDDIIKPELLKIINKRFGKIPKKEPNP